MMELPDEIKEEVLRLTPEDKQKIEDDVVGLIAFFEGLARYFGLALPGNVDEVTRLAGYLRECGEEKDVLAAIRESKPKYEMPNQTGSLEDIPKLWAYLGRLYAQKEGRILELQQLTKEISVVAQRLRELN